MLQKTEERIFSVFGKAIPVFTFVFLNTSVTYKKMQ